MSFLDLSSSPPEGDIVLPIVLPPPQQHHRQDDSSVDRSNASTPTPGRDSGTTTPTNAMKFDSMKEVQVPRHPIPSMQGAFAESFLEANHDSNSIEKSRPGTAAARRKLLLDQVVDEPTHAARWKQRPGQRYHELWKLMAQISFGIYLLMNGIAKDENQVMKILQTHVDEVDDFLETTLEDFDLAQQDIEERLKFLKLPLENIIVFDSMLQDRDFRLQIVSGNEKIEHVITRTAKAMHDALKDVQQGLEACKEFTMYLVREQRDNHWKEERPDMDPEMFKVFEAMKGNVDGWYKAYVSLQTKGNHLGVAMVQLGSIVAEMDRRAGEISRKTRFSIMPAPDRSPPSSPPREARVSRHMRQSMSKDLPSDPNLITPAIRATLPAFQLVQDRERTPEPEPSDIEDELETTFMLKPHTYSPMPSPVAPPEPTFERLSPHTYQQPFREPDQPPPGIRKRSSLRKHFSLTRKEPPVELDTKTQPVSQVVSPNIGQEEARQRVHSIAIHGRQESINTPPSRGLDSAYCSDFDQTSPQPISPHQATNSRSTLNRVNTLENPSTFTRSSGHDFLPSPRSEQQFFRPVIASPHSPLQRPWTAGPSNDPVHTHSNSSTSNLSTYRTAYGHGHTPSTLGNRRLAPSAMGMSVMSGVSGTTMGIDEDGKKVKKKRSAFGWLKKAFSLSEEEKAAFEERRKQKESMEYYDKPPERKWVDGRRVEQRRRPGPRHMPGQVHTT